MRPTRRNTMPPPRWGDGRGTDGPLAEEAPGALRYAPQESQRSLPAGSGSSQRGQWRAEGLGAMARAVYAEHAPPSTLPALHASTRLHAIETHAIVAQVLGQTAFLWDG